MSGGSLLLALAGCSGQSSDDEDTTKPVGETMDRAAVFQFSTTADHVSIDRNDFSNDPAASRLLSLAMADLEAKRGRAASVTTASLGSRHE